MGSNEIIAFGNQQQTVLTSPIGQTVVTVERANYNAVRTVYSQMAYEAREQFEKKYAGYSDYKDFLENGVRDYKECLKPALSFTVKNLVSVGIDDYDNSTIFNFCLEEEFFDGFTDIYTEISDSCKEITDNLEAEKEYRQQRKDNRDRFSADNSSAESLSDVFKNEKDAAIMNLGVGVAHSVFNSISNSISEKNAKKELNSIFNDKEIKNALFDGVFYSVQNIHYVIISLFNDSVDFSIPSEEDTEKATKLFNNLKDGIFSPEKENDVCQSIISLDPYRTDIYEYAIKKFNDKNGEITNLAAYFGENLFDIKDRMAYEYLCTLPADTEEDAIKAKELLIQFANEISFELGIKSKSLTFIDKKLAGFDREYRTVDGVLCSTRDGADLAREELPKINFFIDTIPQSTKDSLLDYEEMVNAKRKEFDELFKSDIKKNYYKKFETLLNDFDNNFRNTRAYGSMPDRKQAGKDRALEYAKLMTFNTLDEYNEQYRYFVAFLPRVGLTEAEATEAVTYLVNERNRVASGKSRTHEKGVTKSQKRLPKILFVISLICFVSGNSFYALLGVTPFIVSIVYFVKIKKKNDEFKAKKNSVSQNSDNKNG